MWRNLIVMMMKTTLFNWCYINKLTNKNINYKSIHKHVPINKNN